MKPSELYTILYTCQGLKWGDFNGREHLMLINGMNGTVKSDLPEKPKESRGFGLAWGFT